MTARYAMGSVALTIVAGWGIWALRGAAPEAQPAPAAAPAGNTLGYAGAGSCSARACHGGTDPTVEQKTSVAQQNEYTTSVAYDKHTQAYQALLSKRARKMAENLAVTNPGGKAIDAHKDERCLACHTTPQFAFENTPAAAVALRGDGVSCEACHGPAKKDPAPWLVEHTSPRKWREKNLSAEDKKRFHFTALGDLRVQAETCAGCHVGAPADTNKQLPARDVNHDLMAAGHPRLNFELTVFRANLPPHWNVSLKQKPSAAVYEAKSWAVGQVASARVSLELLQSRAMQANEARKAGGTPTLRWPEFAEYRCFACHADLNPNWRNREQATGRPGALPYDPWYRTLLPAVPGTTSLSKGYNDLSAEMARPDPDPETVHGKAGDLIKQHNDWLDKAGQHSYDPAAMLKALLAEVKTPPKTWEHATQATVAIAALKYDEMLKALKDPAMKPADVKALEAVVKDLAFPATSESPAGVHGPLAIPKSKFVEDFTTLLKQLGERGASAP